MDRIEAAVRKLTAAVGELANIIPQPHTAKVLATDLIAECQDILDKQLTLEEGDAPGPSAAIAAVAEHANTSDPDNVGEAPLPGVLDHPEQILDAPVHVDGAQQ